MNKAQTYLIDHGCNDLILGTDNTSNVENWYYVSDVMMEFLASETKWHLLTEECRPDDWEFFLCSIKYSENAIIAVLTTGQGVTNLSEDAPHYPYTIRNVFKNPNGPQVKWQRFQPSPWGSHETDQ